MHFDIHCQACASYVRVRVWVGVRVSVEFSYLFNQARCTDVSARSLCLKRKTLSCEELRMTVGCGSVEMTDLTEPS